MAASLVELSLQYNSKSVVLMILSAFVCHTTRLTISPGLEGTGGGGGGAWNATVYLKRSSNLPVLKRILFGRIV